MSACAACQRSGDFRRRADVVHHGLSLCYRHESEFVSDIDALMRLDVDDDPEHAHCVVDDVLLRWAPKPLADTVKEVMDRAPWWASA